MADKLVLDERNDVAAFSKGLLVLPLKADAPLVEPLAASLEDDAKAVVSPVLSQEEVCGSIEGHSDLFQSSSTVGLFKEFVCNEEDFNDSSLSSSKFCSSSSQALKSSSMSFAPAWDIESSLLV